ncbi:MAG TPA: DMT family transporter [Bacteroidia bacterium]|jgi:drug/metabolite transporter (DMT)-like permease|nr:DMT family transporter [Bacteroidia bacterium]
MNKTLRAHLSLLSANLIYAASFTIAKRVTNGPIPPFGLVLLRASGAVVLFWLTALFFVREKAEKKDIPRFALLAVIGVAINQLLFLKGLSLTSPISASIMMITTPILVLIIAALLVRERITVLRISGIFLGFTGAALLMLGNSQAGGRTDNPFGDLFVFINALSWGTYLVLVKPLMKKYHTVTILRWVFLFGLIFVFPFGIQEFRAVNWVGMTRGDWGNALFVVIATTYLAYLLNTYALKELSASVVSAYIYLQPLLAAVIALYVGSDHIDLLKVISACLIFAGVFIVSRPQAIRDDAKQAE